MMVRRAALFVALTTPVLHLLAGASGTLELQLLEPVPYSRAELIEPERAEGPWAADPSQVPQVREYALARQPPDHYAPDHGQESSAALRPSRCRRPDWMSPGWLTATRQPPLCEGTPDGSTSPTNAPPAVASGGTDLRWQGEVCYSGGPTSTTSDPVGKRPIDPH